MVGLTTKAEIYKIKEIKQMKGEKHTNLSVVLPVRTGELCSYCIKEVFLSSNLREYVDKMTDCLEH